jgi:FkbM family methyltransferase
MALEPYEIIASLGDWCGPAANIRRRFGVTEAMPFDWWVSPYNATIKLLEENFANLLQLDNLEITNSPESERNSVRCNYYGMLHHHDFNRDDENKITPDIASQLPNILNKNKFIIDRFRGSFDGKRALFIRNDLVDDLWYPEHGLPFLHPTLEEQINRATRLHALIRNLLSPRQLDIVILSNISHHIMLSLDGGSVIFEVLGERIGESTFWDQNYDLLFDRLGIELTQKDAKPIVSKGSFGNMDFSGNLDYMKFYDDGPWLLDHGIVHESDFYMFQKLKTVAPVVLDIGANKGQSIASFLTLFPEAVIHSFECNPAMVLVLKNLKEKRPELCRNVYIYDCGLADSDQWIKFSIPVVDGKYYFEETTLAPEDEFVKHRGRYEAYGSELTTFDFKAEVRAGDRFGFTPDIIKINAQGAEPFILKGLLGTIKACFPVILAGTSCFSEVNEILFPHGYRSYMPDQEGRIVPLSIGRANVLYVPEQRKAFFDKELFFD